MTVPANLCVCVHLTVLRHRQAQYWPKNTILSDYHDDVIKWKHFPPYWPFMLGIHRSPVNSPHKSQWRGALMFSLICAWINRSVNNGGAGDLRRYRAHYGVIVMVSPNVSYVNLVVPSIWWWTSVTITPLHVHQRFWCWYEQCWFEWRTTLQWRHD